MMRRVIILVLLAAAMWPSTARLDLDLLGAIETIEEKGIDELAQVVVSSAEPQEAGEPACCNRCTICDRRIAELARCQCGDLVRRCHPSCRRCVQAEVLPYPPLYRCLDMSYKACHRNCNRATTTTAASETTN